MTQVTLLALEGIPLIETGVDLARIIITSLDQQELDLRAGDVMVVTSKIVSKAEGRWVDLRDIEPDVHAQNIAEQTGKDPREVAVILRESRRISRVRKPVLIVENHLGITCANAGIDFSNTRPEPYWCLLLPLDPDHSAQQLRAQLQAHYGVDAGVIISDSMGRPFRLGTVGVAIGAAGIGTLVDERQKPDLFEQPMQVTQVGRADEIAAAAGLLSGQTNEGRPVVIVRGLQYEANERASAQDLVRTANEDLYR